MAGLVVRRQAAFTVMEVVVAAAVHLSLPLIRRRAATTISAPAVVPLARTARQAAAEEARRKAALIAPATGAPAPNGMPRTALAEAVVALTATSRAEEVALVVSTVRVAEAA
jgi:hypothetical protein